jgi:hypothetical protein
MTVTVLWHRWFIQYNPFYLASALFVLGGVYLVTRNPADWESEQLVLAGVIELYELALIAGAAFLFNLPSQRRPAVILGIAALVFLFDLTFRSEGMASVGTHTVSAAVAWLFLFGAKLALVARALRVRLPVGHCLAWLGGAAFVPLAPQALEARVADPALVLVAACWMGIGLAALAAIFPVAVKSDAALDTWGLTVQRRIATVVPMLWAALYWAHVVTWCGIYGVKLTALCFAPLVALLPLVAGTQVLAWLVAAIALAIAANWPAGFGHVALLLALGLGLQAWRRDWWTLYPGAVVCAYLGAWKLTGLPLLPSSAWGWGATLLAGAFAALGCGVAVNWWAARAESRIALR